jgi:hypothetical protein
MALEGQRKASLGAAIVARVDPETCHVFDKDGAAP